MLSNMFATAAVLVIASASAQSYTEFLGKDFTCIETSATGLVPNLEVRRDLCVTTCPAHQPYTSEELTRCASFAGERNATYFVAHSSITFRIPGGARVYDCLITNSCQPTNDLSQFTMGNTDGVYVKV
jgi:hypothetical protein